MKEKNSEVNINIKQMDIDIHPVPRNACEMSDV